MEIIVEDTIAQYERLLRSDNKESFYRYTMMKPFEKMWEMVGVPLKAKKNKGYDVLMATQMMGYLNKNKIPQLESGIESLKEIKALETARKTLEECLNVFDCHNLKINADELRFGLYLAESDILKIQNNYCGFGGIPGFIHTIIMPNDYNTPRLPSLIAHEFHHNIRMSYFDWR